MPLDGPENDGDDSGGSTGGGGNSPGREGSQEPSAGPAGTEHAARRPSDATPEPALTPSDSAAPPSSSPAPSSPPAPATTPAPAKLTVSEPEREATDKRWCEKVTLDLHNSGGTAVRSGTVTFGTHIIGALGIDWATVESTAELPAPIGAGAREVKTWTVCVDAWRVPLGMHIETRDVTVRWK